MSRSPGIRWRGLFASSIVAVVLLAGCAGDDDTSVGDGSGVSDTTGDTGDAIDDNPSIASELSVDEDRAIVCSTWGLIVPAAPIDVVTEFADVLGDDAPGGVQDALAGLADPARDPAEVESLLIRVGGYIDPICGSDTAGVLERLGAPAVCPVDDVVPEGDPRDTAIVDIDLDGDDDTAVLYLRDDGTLRVVVSKGGRDETTSFVIEDEMLFADGPLRIETAADVEGDGDADLWVVIGAGSATELYTLLLTEPCGFVRPPADGQPNAFSVGATLGNVDGIECVDLDGNGVLDGFHQYRGEAGAEPGTYRGQRLHWVVDGFALVLLDDGTFTTGPSDPDQRRYGSFACLG